MHIYYLFYYLLIYLYYQCRVYSFCLAWQWGNWACVFYRPQVLWLSVHLIEAWEAASSVEGSRSWTPKTRYVVQRSAGLMYLFQVCLAAEEQLWAWIAEQDLLHWEKVFFSLKCLKSPWDSSMALGGHTEQCCLPQGWWAAAGMLLCFYPQTRGFWYLHRRGAARINSLVFLKGLEDEKCCGNANYY